MTAELRIFYRAKETTNSTPVKDTWFRKTNRPPPAKISRRMHPFIAASECVRSTSPCVPGFRVHVYHTCLLAVSLILVLLILVLCTFTRTRSHETTSRWRKFYRWVGLAATLFNWATLIAVHALLDGDTVEGLDGPRCKLTFEMDSFRLKWIAQFVNQVFQVLVYTLYTAACVCPPLKSLYWVVDRIR